MLASLAKARDEDKLDVKLYAAVQTAEQGDSVSALNVNALRIDLRDCEAVDYHVEEKQSELLLSQP